MSIVVSWAGRGSLLLSGSDDQTCRLWDARAGKAVRCIRGFAEEITAVEFAGEHSLVASSGSSICVYDQRALDVVSHATESAASRFTNSGGGEVQALSARGDFVALVDDDGRMAVFDITDDPLSNALAPFAGGHDALAGCVCIHPNEPVIASGGFDRQVLLWDMASETKTKAFIADSSGACHNDADAGRRQLVNPPFVYALDFAPGSGDGHASQLVSGHADGRLMCLGDDAAFSWSACHRYSISALRFVRARPDILATASLDCTLALWDAESIINPDVAIAPDTAATVVVVGDRPRVLAQVDLTEKPDTLASSETTTVIYTDQGCDIVAYTIS
ncbi:hypothetical protein GGI00_001285 [Coemansia sp. RSA 2681]|nr:hypothetical protein GGI00_001285 [Coemansia sp. RSA 2681]